MTTQPLNAKQLFELAPLGATIKYSDGMPRPPERFVKKVRAWQNSNGTGLFVRAEPATKWGSAGFVLQTLDSPVLVVNMHHSIDRDKLCYEVTPPVSGSILAYGFLSDTVDIKHVWKNLQAAQEWARSRRSVLGKCGHQYFLVTDEGNLVDYQPPQE